MCPNLEVYTQGCSRQMDTLTLTVQPPMTSEEQVVIPPHLLRTHGITLYTREHGLVLHGLADVDVYSNVLKHVRYLYKGKADIARTITVSGFVHCASYFDSFLVQSQLLRGFINRRHKL